MTCMRSPLLSFRGALQVSVKIVFSYAEGLTPFTLYTYRRRPYELRKRTASHDHHLQLWEFFWQNDEKAIELSIASRCRQSVDTL